MGVPSFIYIVVYILVLYIKVSVAIDSIDRSQSLSDGETLVSKGGTFELGFFSPGNSNKRYLGIWYKNIRMSTVVWVANRLHSCNDSSGILTMNRTGNLVLSQNDSVVWYSTSMKQAQNPMARLLDSGNLVVREENEANPDIESYLWQSFDYPSDMSLSGMKIGWDLRIGLNRRLVAWKSWDDPSPGNLSLVIELHAYPEMYIMKGAAKFFRYGPWNGVRFSGSPELRANPIFDYRFVNNKDEVYFTWTPKDHSAIIVVLNQTTHTRDRYLWDEVAESWRRYSFVPQDYCDSYGLCGAFGNCISTEIPVCQCLKGFIPKSPEKWKVMDWSEGCVRNTHLSCEDKHENVFVKLVGLKVPDTTDTLVDETIGLDECKAKCLNNCSCMAYTNSNIRGAGSGCVMWFGNLIDIRQYPDGGQDLYIRTSISELVAEQGRHKKLTVIVVTSIVPAALVILLVCSYTHKARRKTTEESEGTDRELADDLDLPLFDLSIIATATDNFSMSNKIGEGGFGPVYKGILHEQEIAVKRLSTQSGQGIIEFKNEVKLIAKLQHRNLIKLHGCCIQGQEKMLVYEYMSNSSLDSFIFDHIKGKLLNWSKRFQIIYGIARGLMYLHQDSRLRIIHRDLKASNVLLDNELNPKISDFGTAKSCGGDQTEGSTNRIIGTYGYMAPEYIGHGLFSVKSDVFSFGIVLLEIICGKKSKEFYHAGHTLIGHAWISWKEGTASELIDPDIEENSCISSQVLRCIHVSLLCVQHYPEDRPSMPSVVLMLGSEIELAEPKEPGFFPNNVLYESIFNSSGEGGSRNESITELEPR